MGQVMAGCSQATNNYLRQCWAWFVSLCCCTKPQWVNLSCQSSRNIMLGNWSFLWWIASQQNTLHKISLVLGLCSPQRMLILVHLWINSMPVNRWRNCYFWLFYVWVFFHIFMKPDQPWHSTKTLVRLKSYEILFVSYNLFLSAAIILKFCTGCMLPMYQQYWIPALICIDCFVWYIMTITALVSVWHNNMHIAHYIDPRTG